MIFKKKYKRTEWMEGLLLAEKSIKEGCSVTIDEGVFEYTFGPEFYSVINIQTECGINTRISHTGGYSPYFERGVRDYLKHYKENKEILLKTLDK